MKSGSDWDEKWIRLGWKVASTGMKSGSDWDGKWRRQGWKVDPTGMESGVDRRLVRIYRVGVSL